MPTPLPATFFSENRRRLADRLPDDLIVITANGLLQASGDGELPFAQDRNFFYLTGLNEPDFLLILDNANKKELLVRPNLSRYQEIFNHHLTDEELESLTGISRIVSEKEAIAFLRKRLQRIDTIASFSPSPAYSRIYGIYTNPSRRRLLTRLKRVKPSVKIKDIRRDLAVLRRVKQSEEIKQIESAAQATFEAVALIKKKISKYQNEAEIVRELDARFSAQADGHGFLPVVAGGSRSCALHYRQNNAKLDKRTSILLDIGAQVNYYSADVTRVLYRGGATKRQQAVYDAVERIQKSAIAQVKPGVTIRDLELFTSDELKKELIGLKLADKRSSTRRLRRQYMPHGLSHYLGLNTHDVGSYEEPLEPGVVITVEPGIYILDEGIGVRIEDDVLVTDDGYRVLGQN